LDENGGLPMAEIELHKLSNDFGHAMFKHQSDVSLGLFEKIKAYEVRV
jgi:hypothetical protein